MSIDCDVSADRVVHDLLEKQFEK